jgi:hypothetical protein
MFSVRVAVKSRAFGDAGCRLRGDVEVIAHACCAPT